MQFPVGNANSTKPLKENPRFPEFYHTHRPTYDRRQDMKRRREGEQGESLREEDRPASKRATLHENSTDRSKGSGHLSGSMKHPPEDKPHCALLNLANAREDGMGSRSNTIIPQSDLGEHRVVAMVHAIQEDDTSIPTGAGFNDQDYQAEQKGQNVGRDPPLSDTSGFDSARLSVTQEEAQDGKSDKPNSMCLPITVSGLESTRGIEAHAATNSGDSQLQVEAARYKITADEKNTTMATQTPQHDSAMIEANAETRDIKQRIKPELIFESPIPDTVADRGRTENSSYDSGRRVSARCLSKQESLVHKLQQGLEKQNMQVADLERQIASYQASEKQFMEEVSMLHAREEKLKAAKDMLAQRNKELLEKNKDVNTKYRTKLKGIQDKVLQARDATSWNFSADGKIINDIKVVERSIKSFVAANLQLNHNDLDEFLNESNKERGVLVTEAGKVWLAENLHDKTSTANYLSAWITSMIYNGVLHQDPLHLLTYVRVNGDARRDPESRALILPELLTKYYGSDSVECIKFRSDVMRLLAPSLRGIDHGERVSMLELKVKEAGSRAVEHLTQQILKRTQQFLKKSDISQKVQDKLRTIIEKLNGISKILYAQRCQLVCSTAIGALEGKLRYTTGSTKVELHESYSNALIDPEAALDGKDIFLSTRPFLAIIGASDGSDQDSVRVLRKATVWMGPASDFIAQKEGVADILEEDPPLT